MNAEMTQFCENIRKLNRDELMKLCVTLKQENIDLLIRAAENARATTAAAIDFQKYKAENEKLKAENSDLTKALAHEIEKNKLRNRDQFGSKAEPLKGILTEKDEREDINDIENVEDADLSKTKHVTTRSGRNGRTDYHKTPGKRASEYAGLPVVNSFDLQIEELNRKYGEGDWNVAFWKLTRTVEHVRERYYVKNEYTPVISYGYEHLMEMMPRPNVMLKGSVASPTLLSSIIYKKYGLGLPIERQVKEMNVNDLYFLPQTIERWIIRFADEYLWPVYDIFNGIIVNSSYIQSDETFLQVNGIGRKKCYVWVYITSELVKDGHKVIVFSYGPGRSEDHLIETLRGFSGVITSDAYAAYFAYEKDSAGDVTSSLCFMHMRRKWIEALIVLDLKNMSDETIKELPAFKAAKLIAKIYIEENKLRDLPADERLEKRLLYVKPLVDEYFELVKGFARDDGNTKFNEAIHYSIENEDHLRVFLTDGNIPIDNAACERAIRALCLSRKSCLFSGSEDGAKASSIIHSVISTAKINGANAEIYLQYLFEEMPKHMKEKSTAFMEDMLPWSAKYLSYEKEALVDIRKPPDIEKGLVTEKPVVKRHRATNVA